MTDSEHFVARSNHQLVATSWTHTGPTLPYSGRNWSSWPLQRRAEGLKRAGFSGIGLFQDDLAYVLAFEAVGATRRDRLIWVRELLDANGLTFVELEFLVHWMLPKEDPRRIAEQPMRELLLEAAPILGARHIKVGNIGLPAADKQLRENFRELCREAEDAETRIGMEIFPIDPNAQTLDQALNWIAGPSNGGLFLDIWHMSHSAGITLADIALLDRNDVIGVELDDGILATPEEQPFFDSPWGLGFMEHTLNMRRLPGEGNFDIAGFIKAINATGFDGPWGNEILSEEFRRLPMDVAYGRAASAAIRQLDAARPARGTPTL
ncbi:hypothetical protein BH09PSE3_BH09PSE3_23080 [soil metagenome]